MPASVGYSVFRHLAAAFWPNRDPERCVFMVYGITAYYDASSKEEVADRPMVVVGIAATVDQWERLERDWASVLDEKHIEYFDSAACSAWKGTPYKNWARDHGIRDPLLVALAEILKTAAIHVAVARIVPRDFDTVNREYVLDQDEHWPSCYPLLTHWCMRAVEVGLESSAFLTPGYKLAHLIEKGDTGQGVIQKLIDREALPISIHRKWDKKTGDKVHAFAACDLLAFYARKATEVELARERKKAPAVVGVLRQIPMTSATFSVKTLTDWVEQLPDLYPRRSR